jgi:hypothetical protein
MYRFSLCVHYHSLHGASPWRWIHFNLFALSPFFAGLFAAKDRAENQPDSAGHKQAFARIAPHLFGDVIFDFFWLHSLDVIGGVMEPSAGLRAKVRRPARRLIVFSLAVQSFGGVAQFASDPDFDPVEARPARFNLTLATSRRRNFVKTIMQGFHAYFLFLINTEMKAQQL